VELDILLLLSNISNYRRFSSLIREERLSEDVRYIYKDLDSYYSDLDKTQVDWKEFKSWSTTLQHPSISDEKLAVIGALCDHLNMAEPVEDSAVMKNLATRYWANQISETAYSVVTGRSTMEDVKEQIREYNLEVKGVEWDIESLSLSNSELLEQLEDLKNAPKYNWSIPELQLMLGPICKGDFIIVGARPDGGKTTFLCTQAVHFASQLDDGDCVLWCNNEESASRIRLRQTQAALGWTREEVMKDLKKSVKLFEDKVGVGKIRVMDNTTMTVHDIEAAIEACNPKIIFIDQIWKVAGFEKQSGTGIERYAKLAQYVRDLAKRYGPIIGASQLDGTADNVKFPTMGTLYGSKTAVQGEADAVLTIGQSQDEGVDMRFLRAPKNKLSYAKQEFRSAGCAIKIDKERAQLISLLGDDYEV
jgi:hypothetical protein